MVINMLEPAARRAQRDQPLTCTHAVLGGTMGVHTYMLIAYRIETMAHIPYIRLLGCYGYTCPLLDVAT